jgi:ureidoglycolate dehydrogenase (NAD+)
MPLHKTKSPSVEASEHFFYVIDLKQFVDPDRFYAECDRTISEIRAMPPAAGFDKVRMPGEIEWERAENWKINGIPMHGSQVKRLQEAAQSMKIDFSVN